MESFGDLLDSLRFRNQVTAVIELREPWGISFPEIAGSIKFHHITSGAATLAIPDKAPLVLRAGDLALLVNCAHTISGAEGAVCRDIHELMTSGRMERVGSATYRCGGDGAPTSLITGRFVFEHFDTHPFFRLVPAIILIRSEDRHGEDGVAPILNLLVSEATAERPGVRAVMDRLCDLLFFAVVRRWTSLSRSDSGWAAVIRDPEIAAAVDIIHREAATTWTVSQLARQVSLSRSAFAKRFKQIMADSPSSYLASWRMHLASMALLERNESVAAAAELVGYESEAAFAKAFKRRIGMSPGAFRRNHPPQAREAPL